LPAEENTRLENQENQPPPFVGPCPRQNTRHIHSYIAVSTSRRNEWRPQGELSNFSLTDVPTCHELSALAFSFPSVIPFRSHGPHTQKIAPTSEVFAAAYRTPSLSVCSRVLHYLPSAAAPLGILRYSFESSIVQTFLRLPLYLREAFTGALVILDVTDFLDGRLVTSYGYLAFEGNSVFAKDQGIHCEDVVRAAPQLLAHTLTPRLPANPLDFIFLYLDHVPLDAT